MVCLHRSSLSLGSALALAALLVAGCGTAEPALTLRPAAARVQHDSLSLKSSQGCFNVVFQGLAHGYKTLATRADIQSVRITLTSDKLAEPLVRKVGPDQLNQPVVTVSFTDVPAGDVQVKVQALDREAHVIGVKQSASSVSNAQTTVLQMAVRLDADTGSGSLATVISFEDATPAPAATPTPQDSPQPSPTPSATPTPAPSVSPTPGPIILESYRLIRHLFSDPEAEITLKNTTGAGASTAVYMYFYTDNTLKDSQARQVPVSAGQEMTFRVRSNAYTVNKVVVVAK